LSGYEDNQQERPSQYQSASQSLALRDADRTPESIPLIRAAIFVSEVSREYALDNHHDLFWGDIQNSFPGTELLLL